MSHPQLDPPNPCANSGHLPHLIPEHFGLDVSHTRDQAITSVLTMVNLICSKLTLAIGLKIRDPSAPHKQKSELKQLKPFAENKATLKSNKQQKLCPRVRQGSS